MKKIIFFCLFIIASFLVPNMLSATQLVEKVPTELINDWEVCTILKGEKITCNNQKKTSILDSTTKPVQLYTYSKDFIISSGLQLKSIGIKLNVIDEVDEVRLNGHLIGKTGHLPPNFESAFRRDRHYLIPSVLLKYNGINHLKIKTYSSINKPGLNHDPILITDYFKADHIQKNLDYLYAVIIAIFILLMLFQLFYYFMIKDSYDTIYLSIYLFAFALVSFARSNAPQYIGFDLSSTFRIEMFMITTGVISFSFFSFRFFDLQVRKKYIIGIILIALPAIINIIYPNSFVTRQISEVGYWTLCILPFYITGSAMIIALLKKQPYCYLVTLLSSIGWLTLCIDSAAQSEALLNIEFHFPLYIVPVTTMLIGVCLSLTITHKYWQVFKGATYDHLTGTLLRPAFFQRLQEEIDLTQENGSLLLVAVINIQEINNISSNYEEAVGDDLLLLVSNTLTKSLKPFDLVCHFNDEEFCIAAAVKSKQDAEDYLQKIHLYLKSAQQHIDSESQLFINAKISGVIYNSEQHLSVSQLLQDAHYGLQQIKSYTSSDYLLLNNPNSN